MPGQIIGGPSYGADDGSAHPGVAAAMAAYAAGGGNEHAVLTALASSRLLVPLVAAPAGAAREQAHGPGDTLAHQKATCRHEDERTPADAQMREHGGHMRERPDGAEGRDAAAGGRRRGRREPGRSRGSTSSEMVLPTLVGKDGRHAVLAFTCLDALARWRPEARPVPVPAARVWQAGAQAASAVVIDVAGPVPLAVDGARLAALAEGRAVPPAHEDPDVLAGARDAAGDEPLIAAAVPRPGSGTSDLMLDLTTVPGRCAQEPAVQAAVERVAGAVMAAAGGRLRRGIEVAITQAGSLPAGLDSAPGTAAETGP